MTPSNEKDNKRKRDIDRINKVIALRDNTECSGERRAASKRLEEMMEKMGVSVREVLCEKTKEELNKLEELYGPYTDYVVLGEKILKLSVEKRNTSYFNSFYREKRTIINPHALDERGLRPVTTLEQKIFFTDKTLKREILKALKSKKNEVTFRDLLKLEALDVSGKNVKDLYGLHLALNLKKLNASDNPINDLSWLTPLQKLTELNISGTKIKDLSPLSECVKLKKLNISKNLRIKDVLPILGLRLLRRVDLRGTGVEKNPYLSKQLRISPASFLYKRRICKNGKYKNDIPSV